MPLIGGIQAAGDSLPEEDLREQVRSDRFSRLLELMESASERPQLRFELGSETRGLDYVEEVRADVTRRIRLDPGSGTAATHDRPGETTGVLMFFVWLPETR